MVWQWMLRGWLYHTATQHLAQLASAEMQKRQALEQALAAGQKCLCDIGIVCAQPAEAGGLLDLMPEAINLQGAGFQLTLGIWQELHVALVVTGEGAENVQRGLRALIDAHEPAWVFSVGFCSGLQPESKFGDLCLPTEIVGLDGLRWTPTAWPENLALPAHMRLGGRMASLARAPRGPQEKRACGQKYQAAWADSETRIVGDWCAQRQIPWNCVRVVLDAQADAWPKDWMRIKKQKSWAGQFGAAVGALLDSPGAAGALWNHQERQLAASDRLAKGLDALLAAGRALAPPPEALPLPETKQLNYEPPRT